MRFLQSVAIVGLMGLAVTLAILGPSVARAQQGRVAPVVVELYTSEGCSSCPAADRVLSDFVHAHTVAGVEVIALGEHVDYWNYLGWTDRFSSPAFTQRQRDYQKTVFAPTPVYTPQLVVDGRLEAVGSNRGDVRRALQRAAEIPKADVRLAASTPQAATVSVGIEVVMPAGLALDGPADVVVAVVEDGLVTEVPRGENRGRTLEHDAVVRRLETVGELRESETRMSLTAPIGLAQSWRDERLRIVAFVQERDSRRILGAAAAELPQ